MDNQTAQHIINELTIVIQNEVSKTVKEEIKGLESQFEEIDKRLEQMDRRFEQIDSRSDQIDRSFEQIDIRFDQMDSKFEQIDSSFDQMDSKFEKIDSRFDQMDTKFEHIEERMNYHAISLHNQLNKIVDNSEKITTLFEITKQLDESYKFLALRSLEHEKQLQNL